jgi:predicted metal-dependent peptidase
MRYLNTFNKNFNKFDKINEAADHAAAMLVRQSLRLIMSHFGFFADLFLQLRIGELRPGSKCKTACTDGKSILYNAAFVKSLETPEQLAFVLLHELLHNANFHFARMGDRHAKRWNRAADYAINLQIVQLEEETKYGTFSPPKKILLSDKYKIKATDGTNSYHIMSAEEIYAILDALPRRPKPPKQKPEPIQIYPGMKVRIKATGKKGIVRQIAGGKFVIDEIEEEYQSVVESLNEAAVSNLPTVGNPQVYDRSDFIPIQKKEKGGKGGMPPPPTNDEFEEEGDDDDDDEEEDDGMDDDDDDEDGDGGDDDEDEDDDNDGDEDTDLTDGDIMKPGSLDKDGDPIKGYEGQDDFQKANPKDLEKIWKDSITNARVKNAGTGSSSMDRRFSKIDKPKINWRQRLRKFVNSVFANDPFYGYFNKRFIADDEYLPGIKYPNSDGFRRIVLIIDTSGSITKETLGKFATEFYGILKGKKILETIFIWCDDEIIGKPDIVPTTQIRSESDFASYLARYVKPRGGGGTSFIPPFDWIEKNLINKGQIPSFVVYFTDAAGPAPRYNEYKIPRYNKKILWVITETAAAPHITFGEKIFIDVDPDSKH